ncbi:MAG: phosphoadenosine phosphosulfate reductase family protein, partial [Acholeplasmatales bacterium]|nr:phosphoadenosine phosphosulfate reductase family protein [Acholeplasmatales bacterium]
TEVFFCANCNAPSFEKKCNCCGSNCDYIGTDLRPVFPEERLLIEVLIHEPFKFAGKSIWNVGGSKYIVDGKKLNLSYKELREKNDCKDVIEELKKYTCDNQQYVDSYMQSNDVVNFIKINRPRLNSITYEAIEYIRYIAKDKDESEMFVSFSGGKDSTVTSDLVMNALSNKKIIHIYGDTTLEYPTSEVYVKRFRANHPNIPLLTAKNRDQDFNNLCELIGPPARMMRWCCTVFKTGAITKKIDSTFKNVKQLITFQGIRRNESASRNKYDRESNDSKIKKQIAVEPIIDWMDFDVWLYILSNNIDFNDAYKQGFSRVGCWCCPNNSSWSEYLSSIYMNEEFNKFRDILYKFAEKIGKPDWKTYVDDGEWKKRQGGNGLEISKKTVVSFKPCALEENTYNFNLTKNIGPELYKFFIPFGKLNFEIGKKALNEVYVLDKKSNMPILKLSGREGTDLLKVTIVDDSKTFKVKKNAEMLLKNQINKYQTCIGCTYCEAVCTHDAIKVFNTDKGNVSNDTIHYSIDPDKCVGCLECVKHFQNGCYINKVLRTKKED